MSQRSSRTKQPRSNATAPCPCGEPMTYGDCCGRLHSGADAASTAEELMRSRFSAFAVGDQAYLLRSWHPGTRPSRLDLDPRTLWVRLEVLGTTGGTPFHTEGTVTFRAHYREGGSAGELREHSRFLRHQGAWVYLDALAGA